MLTPESPSVQVKLTVTLELFHPAALGDGVRDAASTGGVASSFTVTEAELESPVPFVAEQVSVTPAVSPGKAVVPHPEEDAMPDSGSVTLQLTVTGLRYQPPLPEVPLMVGVMSGGVASPATSTEP